MKEAKVTQIVSENSSWTSSQGTTLHDYCVTLESSDGAVVEGVASSTSAENPPYAVGDQVFYEQKDGPYGTKLKIKKEQPQGGSFSGGGGDRQKEIAVQWAIGRATEVLPYDNGRGYYEAVKRFAETLLELKDEILKS